MMMRASNACAHNGSPSVGLLGRLACALAVGLLVALGLSARASAVPSAVIHYGPTLPAGLDQYAAPGNVIVVTAEQRVRNPARIRAWRSKGAIVLGYVNALDFHPPDSPIYNNFTGGNFPSAWIHPTGRAYQGSPLLNLTASCPVATYNGFTGAWGEYVAHWIRNTLIQDGSIFNGAFLDGWGDKVYTSSPVIGGPGSDWEAGIARWGAAIRAQVGPNIFLVGNSTHSQVTAAPLNGRVWESFSSAPTGGWNMLTGPVNGLIQSFAWPAWDRPQLDILWRNEANPSAATKQMLVDAANRVTKTGSDIAVGSSDHQGGFPPPFGGPGGFAPPPSIVPGFGTPGGRSTAGAGGAGKGAAKRRRLVASEFLGGRLSPWRALKSRRGVVKGSAAHAGRVTLVAPRGTPSFAALSAALVPEGRTTLTAKLKLTRIELPNTRARALLSVGAADGRSRQVGVLRDPAGVLRWAMWTRTPDGGRIELTATQVAVPLRRWVRLRLKTNWAGGIATAWDRFAVDGRIVALSNAGSLAGKRAANALVGFGRNSTNQESAVGVLGSASIVARD